MSIREGKAGIEIIEKYIKPFFSDYYSDKSDTEKLTELLIDIESCQSAVLEERFKRIYSSMKGNEEEFSNLVHEAVLSLDNVLNQSINVWKDRAIYFKDVTEVWVACEPMLDLIDDDQGGFDLLERQLLHVDRITYFLTDKTYFDDLKKFLNERGKDHSKLNFVKIDKKLHHPVVIYITKDYKHGMRGKYYPKIQKNGDLYEFDKKLPKNWLSYIKRSNIHMYTQILEKYLNPTQTI